MADRLSDISAQIHNIRQLESVVTAIRGIAASRTQQSRGMLAGVTTYAGVVAGAITQALALVPDDDAPLHPKASIERRGAVCFCAEHGFAGALSERVLEVAGTYDHGGTVLLVGTRGQVQAQERGLTPVWWAAQASSADTVPALAHRITEALDRQVASGLSHIDIVFPRHTTAGMVEIEKRSLLPVDLAAFAAAPNGEPPLVMLPPERLVERLADEYVFARLCEAALIAFEAENEARMAAMSAAKSNIRRRLEDLKRRERQLRQEAITTEVIELAAGATALRHSRQ